jgi:hypothetical protein
MKGYIKYADTYDGGLSDYDEFNNDTVNNLYQGSNILCGAIESTDKAKLYLW